MWIASQVSLKTKYFIKVVVGLIIMQTALVLMARTGVGIYALPLSFLFALMFLWLVWPKILHTSELSETQLTVMRVCQAALLGFGFLGTWIISLG